MKISVGVLGATGMVGQRFITLLKDHPWFEVAVVAASPRSAGKAYSEAVEGRWVMEEAIPDAVSSMTVNEVEKDREEIVKKVQLVFCALDMDKEDIKRVEDLYAKDIPVVSNNSAHRWTEDVPMVMPEINGDHLKLIETQKKNHGRAGFIVVKPNCSVQSYVPLLTPLQELGIEKVFVTTFQAVSGAGKTMENWEEMQDNVIPFIGGEEEKSEKEPLKIWGKLSEGKIDVASEPVISATCVRVPVNDGHMAVVSVKFSQKPKREQIIEAWRSFNPLEGLGLPSAPAPFITYFDEENRPQTRLDRDLGGGMGISAGRLREDTLVDFKFIGLSHNTIRGAAGGAILTAELLKAKGYL